MNFRSKGRTHPIAALLTVATLLGSGAASAQLVVNDPVNYAAKLQQLTKDAAEFGKQAKRWSETASHYQQQLVRLQRMNFGGLQMQDTFDPRPMDYGMEDLCPGKGGGIREQLTSKLRQALPKLDGNIVDEQQAICQRMVHAENSKYNDSVQMLRSLAVRSQQFQLIEQQRDATGTSQGALAANDNEAQRFVLRTELELDHWQARMKAYNDYIESLKWDQSRLAKRALRGKKGSLDSIVPSDAIKSALLN
ncbi:hypothetical protein [Lysobacter sp. CA196]|uniref:hypothetical protein n=1 Tax=Lysobacter sp. CA196 TaxID=3455606 RepID=UPI003F8D076F